jgi:hypothetical protein
MLTLAAKSGTQTLNPKNQSHGLVRAKMEWLKGVASWTGSKMESHQSMVKGNGGMACGLGMAFTRCPTTNATMANGGMDSKTATACKHGLMAVTTMANGWTTEGMAEEPKFLQAAHIMMANGGTIFQMVAVLRFGRTVLPSPECG